MAFEKRGVIRKQDEEIGTNERGATGRREAPPSDAYEYGKGMANRGSFWHGFANMANVTSENEVVIVRGVGCEVLDQEGRWYLDATAGLWYCNAGYGRQSIAEAVERQMRELPAYSTFGLYANEPALELCERVSRLAPLVDGKVFLTCESPARVTPERGGDDHLE
ncbi:MAG: hypothetical protein AVDCRST_MAG78-2500 [uncultured Rubrobacteraceae bacterium]|uniref:Aminotransferase class III-fold pyridoxal phosphate-dependent enzyme n=1 Tax=uncultured Rubrobacteraceae bacterium TaxID=349277 RepID=A0A6J4QDD4_9ACTN|nr:MAG: hypothetical protein AVDCRST_MAG78-2500 [uncultured Rubrobacteraceae bacterium]